MNLEKEAIYIKSLQLKARELRKNLAEVENALNDAGVNPDTLTDAESKAKNEEIARKMRKYFSQADGKI